MTTQTSKIPSIAWFFFGLSSLLMASGYAVGRFQATLPMMVVESAKTEILQDRIQLLSAIGELEKAVAIVEQQDANFDFLVNRFEYMTRHNQPAKILEPTIAEIKRLDTGESLPTIQTDLNSLRQKLNQN